MIEFGLMWQQFDTIIFCHLTAIVTKKKNKQTNYIFFFAAEDKKMVTKAWNIRIEVPLL